MTPPHTAHHAYRHVYVVRIWLEPSAPGAGGWRAAVTETASREVRYFENPQALAVFLGLAPPPDSQRKPE